MSEEVKTIRMKKNHCLRCRAVMDAAIGVATPEPGDFSICVSYAHLMVFTEDLSVREANAEELRIAKEHPDLARTIRAMRGFAIRHAARRN